MNSFGQTPRTATITYLSQSGYCVETEKTLFIFDYPPNIDNTLKSYIVSKLMQFERERKRIIIVYTHVLSYSFYDPLLRWNNVHNLFLYGWLFAGGHDSVGIPQSDSLQLYEVTIYGHKAVQSGSGVLLKLPEITIYHSGNNVLQSENDYPQFDAGLQFIRSHSKEIDVAFIPVNHFKNNNRKNNFASAGAMHIMDVLPARNFFVMSSMQYDSLAFSQFKKRMENSQREYPVLIPKKSGQNFTIELK